MNPSREASAAVAGFNSSARLRAVLSLLPVPAHRRALPTGGGASPVLQTPG